MSPIQISSTTVLGIQYRIIVTSHFLFLMLLLQQAVTFSKTVFLLACTKLYMVSQKEAIKTCKSEEGVAKNAKTSESLVLSDEEEGGGCKCLYVSECFVLLKALLGKYAS